MVKMRLVKVVAVTVAVAVAAAGCSSRKKKRHAPQSLQITTTSLPAGYDGQTGYSARLRATGGTGTYTWSIISGDLPPGLVLDSSTGEISGDIAFNASAGSPYDFTVEVSDGQETARADLSITVYAQLQITTTSLPGGYDDQTGYSATLTAIGGTGSYTWQVVSGSLPPNLSLDSSGLISGDIASNASANSPYNFTVEVTDGQQTVQANLSISVWQQLRITTTTLPAGYEGQLGYSAKLTATGGNSANCKWSVSGTLPCNLSWDAAAATLSGDIATGTAGDYLLRFEVTDGIQTAAVDLTLTVLAQLRITTTSLLDAVEGITYSYTVVASGGDSANYDWGISGRPSWLAIDAATGELSGTPPTGSVGRHTFTVIVDDGQQTASKQFSLLVRPTPISPKADFEADITEGTAPLAVTFTDKSTGTITQWEWDFDGDGAVDSTEQHPSWAYNDPGWYTVKLTVTGPVGSDTCVKELYVLVYENMYYVNGANGDDANSGKNWNNAWKTIEHALWTAGDYDLVLVADATYDEMSLDFNGKKIYLKGVDHNTAGAQPIIDCGGSSRVFYFHSGETKETVLDNFTIRNGAFQNGGAICCENSSSPTLRNCAFSGNSADYGGAIYCSSSSPTITNCTFSNNRATGSFPHGYGGAIYCTSSSPTITDCTFSDNWAVCGGAIRCCSSSPTLTNCTFTNNEADDEGGVIWCYDSSPSITDCTFSGNTADHGGAVWCTSNSSPTLTNCTFSNNSAGRGGALRCGSSSPTLTNCTFSGNKSWNHPGGAILCSGGSLTLTNCTFSDNSGGDQGGAIYCSKSSLTIVNCTFSGNSAGQYGGAIYCSSCNPTITDCIFNGNSSVAGGGAICCTSSSPTITNCIFISNRGTGGSGGGAIRCENSSSPTVTNCTFIGNSATVGGAIGCFSSGSSVVTNCTFSGNSASKWGGALYCAKDSGSVLNNSILWGNSAGSDGNEVFMCGSSSSCTLNYCCVDDTGYGGQTGKIVENNCIHSDPQFVDANGADNIVGTSDDDLHLQDTSPCVDAGDNSLVPSGVDKDLDGKQRIVDGDGDGTATVDIGA
ncbi:MAG: hypothetical protein DRP63_03755, partial [Planctomycetota bacterium]